MKHLKTFEAKNYEPKIGDYIEIDSQYYKGNPNGKIVDIDSSSFNVEDSCQIWYDVELVNGTLTISKNMIIRKLNKKESEITEFELSTKKYNL